MALYALYAMGDIMGALVFPHTYTVCRHFIHQSPSIVQCRVYFTLLLIPLASVYFSVLSHHLSIYTHIQSTNKSGILVLIALNSNNNSNHILYYREKWKNNTYRIIIIILFKTTFVVVVWSKLPHPYLHS